MFTVFEHGHSELSAFIDAVSAHRREQQRLCLGPHFTATALPRPHAGITVFSDFTYMEDPFEVRSRDRPRSAPRRAPPRALPHLPPNLPLNLPRCPQQAFCLVPRAVWLWCPACAVCAGPGVCAAAGVCRHLHATVASRPPPPPAAPRIGAHPVAGAGRLCADSAGLPAAVP